MITFTRSLVFLTVLSALTLTTGTAQTEQIVVQAANAPTPAPKQVVTPDATSLPAAIKLLEQIKVANEETLKKQEAAMQQLDEIGKAAQQIKIFSHGD